MGMSAGGALERRAHTFCRGAGGLEASGEATGRVSGSGGCMPGREHAREELLVVEPRIFKAEKEWILVL